MSAADYVGIDFDQLEPTDGLILPLTIPQDKKPRRMAQFGPRRTLCLATAA
jgi:hypothetical protein